MTLRAASLSLCEQLCGFFWHWQALEPEQQIHSMVLPCLLLLVSNTLLHNVVPSQTALSIAECDNAADLYLAERTGIVSQDAPR